MQQSFVILLNVNRKAIFILDIVVSHVIPCVVDHVSGYATKVNTLIRGFMQQLSSF